ncbi:MAG: phosphate signaling complex protein PhoU [Verrucomicrobia bacterium]|nr:phosphate signaling complex protein PhoU [Verrucomicrobiota bacterium]
MSPLPGDHILGSFDAALNSLREDVLLMASLTERNLANTFASLFTRDTELANQVIADDEEIDALEKQVDSEGIDILLRFQPVARDLRAIVATMKLGANLERVADQATSIARRARKLNSEDALPETHELEAMAAESVMMLKDSLRAFTDGDMELALTIKPRDKELDALNLQLNTRFTELMARSPEQIRSYLDLIFIARNIERIGDHATNIAEDAVYAKDAQDIRHLRAAAAAAANNLSA